jgi:hypothetical protein
MAIDTGSGANVLVQEFLVWKPWNSCYPMFSFALKGELCDRTDYGALEVGK